MPNTQLEESTLRYFFRRCGMKLPLASSSSVPLEMTPTLIGGDDKLPLQSPDIEYWDSQRLGLECPAESN